MPTRAIPSHRVSQNDQDPSLCTNMVWEPILDAQALPDIETLVIKLQGSLKVEEERRLLSLRGGSARSILHECQAWLDVHPDHKFRRKIIRLEQGIAAASEQLPHDVCITGVHIARRDPAKFGAFADVFRGTWNGKPVALKRLRVNDEGEARSRLDKEICKEGLIWRQLKHRNILPFYGVDSETFATPALVSPWMQNGTIMNYIRSKAHEASLDRLSMIIEVAEGLNYLHEQQIAHGDLHSGNVLISDDGHPCLTDFGFTVVGVLTRSQPPTSTGSAGNNRWIPPEAFSQDPRKTLAGDVFSFGRMCLAICTGRPPFADVPDRRIWLLAAAGVHPPRPTEADCGGYLMSVTLWNLAIQCWAMVPEDRPTMPRVLAILRRAVEQ